MMPTATCLLGIATCMALEPRSSEPIELSIFTCQHLSSDPRPQWMPQPSSHCWARTLSSLWLILLSSYPQIQSVTENFPVPPEKHPLNLFILFTLDVIILVKITTISWLGFWKAAAFDWNSWLQLCSLSSFSTLPLECCFLLLHVLLLYITPLSGFSLIWGKAQNYFLCSVMHILVPGDWHAVVPFLTIHFHLPCKHMEHFLVPQHNLLPNLLIHFRTLSLLPIPLIWL